MSAEALRRAAELMRERAEAAPDQPRTDADVTGVWLHSRFHLTTTPAVVLAVADWLDCYAAVAERELPIAFDNQALAVARAYLGESA